MLAVEAYIIVDLLNSRYHTVLFGKEFLFSPSLGPLPPPLQGHLLHPQV
jgi:hypothetical protein